MHILHVFPFLSPNANGTIALIRQLSLALARRGHEVGIFTSNVGLNEEYIESLKPVTLYTYSNWVGMIWQARKIVKTFDVIHIHCFRSLQNIVVCHYALQKHLEVLGVGG